MITHIDYNFLQEEMIVRIGGEDYDITVDHDLKLDAEGNMVCNIFNVESEIEINEEDLKEAILSKVDYYELYDHLNPFDEDSFRDFE